MLKIIPIVIVLTLVSVGVPAQAQRPGAGPVPVIVSPVRLQDFADSVEALGTTRANEMIVVTADTAEKVTAIHFAEGQAVKKGDLLITLAKGEEDADLKAAQAQLSEARLSYNRARELQESNALSEATLQERLALLKQRRAAIAAITARLDKRAITAPFDGMLGLREVSVGTLVQPGDAITTLNDIHLIKVDFNVPSIFLPALKPGLSVNGQVDAYPGREFTGEVHMIDAQVDPVTRTLKVRAHIPNEDQALRPGMLMTITLRKNERRALIIPEEALVKRGARNFVYVVEETADGTVAREKEIETGGRMPGSLEVLNGLQEGEQVINHGTIRLTDGALVQIRAVEQENKPLRALLEQNEKTAQDAMPAGEAP